VGPGTSGRSGAPSWCEHRSGRWIELQTIDELTSLRDQAVESLKKKADFRVHLLSYVMVNTFLVIIWAVTGADFFWPVFPIAGWGIGVVFHAWDAYGRGVPTEEQIRVEMDRLSRRDDSVPSPPGT
jgi:2TM domain